MIIFYTNNHIIIFTSNNPSQGIPSTVIEPVVEVVEALLGQELCSAVVEVRIKLVDDGLKPQH